MVEKNPSVIPSLHASPMINDAEQEKYDAAQLRANLHNAALLVKKEKETDPGKPLEAIAARKLLSTIVLTLDEDGTMTYHIPLKAVQEAKLSEENWVMKFNSGFLGISDLNGEPAFKMQREFHYEGMTLKNTLLEKLETIAGITYEQATSRKKALDRGIGEYRGR